MSLFVSALDNYTPLQIGEKGSSEYTWSYSIRERLIQIHFQLTRIQGNNDELKNQVKTLLSDLLLQYNSNSISKEEFIEYMSLFYRMVAYTRDINGGKGEYHLSYMLLDVWKDYSLDLAQFALTSFVMCREQNDRPFGSWKDIKYLYKYNKDSPLIQHGIRLIVEQLKQDVNREHPSLAAKWVPREKSAFGGLFTLIATQYFSEYFGSCHTLESKQAALNKAKMNLRKIISTLNKKLDTVQIKQCAQMWANIEPKNQTAITMNKQKRAFLNIGRKGCTRYHTEDRIICATHFQDYIKQALNGEAEIKGQQLGLNDFTKEAKSIIDNGRKLSDEANILNLQWKNNSTQNGALGKMVAVVDTSSSMYGDPINTAIALGIRVAEKSILGKRVLTFNTTPEWINLDGHDTFIDMVDVLYKIPWGGTTNFEAALGLILNAIISQRLQPDDVEDMVLAIFSDMQMDCCVSKSHAGPLFERIQAKYAAAGNRLWGKPFKAPHILFWNLRFTSGFPSLSSFGNASMMSGFNPSLLNLFCEEGITSLQNCTPWSLFVKALSVERYKSLDEHIRTVFCEN